MLELLGVDPSVLVQHPSAVAPISYPPRFLQDPSLIQKWTQLCKDTTTGTTENAWNRVLRRFLFWARTNHRRIYPDKLNRVDNNEIQTFLMLRRRWVVQHIDRLGILENLAWTNVEQTVTSTPLGITVHSALLCRDVDYAQMKARLEFDRWRPNTSTRIGYDIGYRDWWRWLKVSETGVTRLGFSAPGNMRAIFWYSVLVPAHPYLPPGADLQTFVLQQIWNPIVRTLRFKSIKRICVF